MTEPASPKEVAQAAFGQQSRARLLDLYFGQDGAVTAANAWLHVYRLLLWIDRTTGLAHCYESDKSQPGRHWYGRTLRFHDWLCAQLGCSDPSKLGDGIDWLFKRASADLAAWVEISAPALMARAAIQRAPYAGRNFPEAGLDPELTEIIIAHLQKWGVVTPPAQDLAGLTTKIHDHLRAENKRRNLLGEGFEDVLARIVGMVATRKIKIMTRPELYEIGGFHPRGAREKPKRVDLVIVDANGHRHLVTAKWSIRADREEQFRSDFDRYEARDNTGAGFDHIVITNEFDGARLVAACDRMVGVHKLFTRVVHVNPEAVLKTYDAPPVDSQKVAAERIASGRLLSLENWLSMW